MQRFIKTITLALLQYWALRQSLLGENCLLNLGVAIVLLETKCFQKDDSIYRCGK